MLYTYKKVIAMYKRIYSDMLREAKTQDERVILEAKISALKQVSEQYDYLKRLNK